MAKKLVIRKKMTSILVATLFFVSGFLFVYAYNSGGPPNVIGHSEGEVHVTLSNGTVVLVTHALNDLEPGALECQTTSKWYSNYEPFWIVENPGTHDCSGLGSEYRVTGGSCYDFKSLASAFKGHQDGPKLNATSGEIYWECKGKETGASNDYKFGVKIKCCR